MGINSLNQSEIERAFGCGAAEVLENKLRELKHSDPGARYTKIFQREVGSRMNNHMREYGTTIAGEFSKKFSTPEIDKMKCSDTPFNRYFKAYLEASKESKEFYFRVFFTDCDPDDDDSVEW